MSTISLTSDEQAMLAGDGGVATQLAARLLVRMAELMGAERLVPIASAHVDGCLYHGPVSIDFAERLVAGGGSVRVETTLNVGAVDLLHPELNRGDPTRRSAGRELMRLYSALGCRPTWTCAPYQLANRPSLGEQIAWAESNAIVFANSVLGARTERYGDFIDIAAALTGRAPYVGLHTDEGRLATLHFRVERMPARLAASDVLFAALGYLIGRRAERNVPVIDGIEHATEDQLKALGAAAASSGSVAMFHMVGITPEASTLAVACGHRTPRQVIPVSRADLADAATALTSAGNASLGAVSVGTPHFSFAEFERLRSLLGGRRVSDRVAFYASTGRGVQEELRARDWLDDLTAAGVTIVTDTCTYLAPIMAPIAGAVMTNSAKWAWYGPNNLGIKVIFGSLEECVESAVRGERWRDGELWRDDRG
jgi:predicted aconitase